MLMFFPCQSLVFFPETLFPEPGLSFFFYQNLFLISSYIGKDIINELILRYLQLIGFTVPPPLLKICVLPLSSIFKPVSLLDIFRI